MEIQINTYKIFLLYKYRILFVSLLLLVIYFDEIVMILWGTDIYKTTIFVFITFVYRYTGKFLIRMSTMSAIKIDQMSK